MSVRLIPFIACRLFSLYIFYRGFILIAEDFLTSGFFFVTADVNAKFSHVSACSYGFGSFILAAFFWFKAELLSFWIAGRYSNYDIGISGDAKSFQNAGFAVVGLAVMSCSIEPLTQAFRILYALAIFKPATTSSYGHLITDPLVSGVCFLLWGLFILFRASWLTEFLSRRHKQ